MEYSADAEKRSTLAKCDRLPNLEDYLGAFCQLQYDAYHYHLHQGHHQILSDYSSLLHLVDFTAVSPESFNGQLKPEIEGHYHAAAHFGFVAPYLYKLIEIC